MPLLSIIFFDAAGTIINPHPSVGEVYAEVAREVGITLDPHAVQRVFREAFARVEARVRQERPMLFGSDHQTATAFWREVLIEIFNLTGVNCPNSDEFFTRVYDEFASPTRYAPVQGVIAVFEQLTQAGHRLGLISNWDQRLRRILPGLGLDRWFDPIIISTEVGVEKPDCKIFEIALAQANVPAAEALMIGDSIDADVEGPCACGMQALLFDPRDTYTGPRPKITHMAELPGWIETQSSRK